jgi:hypothetical protein
LKLSVIRYQKPEQAGQESVRTGVFFIPSADKKSARKNYHSKGNPNYGGPQELQGTALLKHPLIFKASTGGRAPLEAYASLKGKAAAEKLDKDTISIHQQRYTPYKGLSIIDIVEELLDQYGVDSSNAKYIIDNSNRGNQLKYALQERIIAETLREAGYDSMLAYNRGKLTELFDLRHTKYPTPGEELSSMSPELDWERWVFKKSFKATAASSNSSARAIKDAREGRLQVPKTPTSWWDGMSGIERKAYLMAHPNSKYAQEAGKYAGEKVATREDYHWASSAFHRGKVAAIQATRQHGDDPNYDYDAATIKAMHQGFHDKAQRLHDEAKYALKELREKDTPENRKNYEYLLNRIKELYAKMDTWLKQKKILSGIGHSRFVGKE